MGQGGINEYNVGSKSLTTETPASKPSHMAVIDNDSLKASVEAGPRKTKRDIAEDLEDDHTTLFLRCSYLKQIGKTKKPN